VKRLAVVTTLCASSHAAADPIQLRADALATTAAPAGLVTVAADGDMGPGLSAEAVVWAGGGTINSTGAVGDSAHAEVLVMTLRAHTADNRVSGRIGRFIESLGALRPVQIDGAAGRVLLPHRIDIEVFAGIPVVPDLAASRAWDWIAGGRVSRRIGNYGSVGLAYAEQREDGELVSEEVGVDAGASLGKLDDVGAKLAYDLANPGIAEATLSASHRFKKLRVELYSSYLAASHLLPATSLFTVLGDVPAERVGTTLTWKAAPRLDVGGDLGVRYADGDTAPEIVARVKLRLDERGKSALSGELRRDGVGDSKWTGLRGVARVALPHCLSASTELELVIPDHDHGLGAVWPWALVALAWDNGTWHTAIAGEADASPLDRRRVDVLLQLGRQWGTK
jgi:hypothetical protein